MGLLGSLLWACPLGCPHAGHSWSGYRVGIGWPIFGWESYHWWGVGLHSLESFWLVKSQCWGKAFPSHKAPPLTSKTLERVWVLASSYTPLHWAHGCPDHCPGSLCPLLPIPWVGFGLGLSGQGCCCHCGIWGDWGCSYHYALSVATCPGTTWDTGGITALSSLGQGSHQVGNPRFPHFCFPPS